jgi:hypothetical protein
MTAELNRLRDFLKTLPSGEIQEVSESKVEELLSARWDDLSTDDEGMEGYKLGNRMEAVKWEPPILTFEIERHGGTVLGSVQAEVQCWTVDVEQGSATVGFSPRKRLVGVRRKPLKVGPIADEIVKLVIAGKEVSRLKWYGPTKVRVLPDKILPLGLTIPKETLQGRRKRLGKAIEDGLASHGWKKVSSQHTYERES